MLLCSRQSILWQSRFRADAVLVSLLYGECVLYDAVAIVLFTSLEKHIDEASPAFLTMDILRFFVLVFFGSFAFGVIPGAWSPGVTTKQSISVCSRITRSAPGVSPHISRLPSHSSGVLCGIVSLFFLQFMLEKAFRTLAHFVGNLFFGSSMWSALCPCGAPCWFFLDGRCPCCAVATGCSFARDSPQLRLLDRSVRPVCGRLHRGSSWTRWLCVL